MYISHASKYTHLPRVYCGVGTIVFISRLAEATDLHEPGTSEHTRAGLNMRSCVQHCDPAPFQTVQEQHDAVLNTIICALRSFQLH